MSVNFCSRYTFKSYQTNKKPPDNTIKQEQSPINNNEEKSPIDNREEPSPISSSIQTDVIDTRPPVTPYIKQF